MSQTWNKNRNNKQIAHKSIMDKFLSITKDNVILIFKRLAKFKKGKFLHKSNRQLDGRSSFAALGDLIAGQAGREAGARCSAGITSPKGKGR